MTRAFLCLSLWLLCDCKDEHAPSTASAEAELDRITRDLAPVSDRLAAAADITDLAAAKVEVDALVAEHARLAERVAAIRASTAVSAEARRVADRLAAELASTQVLLEDVARSLSEPTPEKPR